MIEIYALGLDITKSKFAFMENFRPKILNLILADSITITP